MGLVWGLPSVILGRDRGAHASAPALFAWRGRGVDASGRDDDQHCAGGIYNIYLGEQFPEHGMTHPTGAGGGQASLRWELR